VSVIEEAIGLVHGARQESYGHPYDDFSRTGRMWGAILGIPDVAPDKVGLCLAAVKISREVNAPKRDNLVDLAGYAETVALIRERENVTVPTVTTVTLGSTQAFSEYEDLVGSEHVTEPTVTPVTATRYTPTLSSKQSNAKQSNASCGCATCGEGCCE